MSYKKFCDERMRRKDFIKVNKRLCSKALRSKNRNLIKEVIEESLEANNERK